MLFKARICFVYFALFQDHIAKCLQYIRERPWIIIHCDDCSTNSLDKMLWKPGGENNYYYCLERFRMNSQTKSLSELDFEGYK